jgi:hypothetical protein
MPSLYPLRIDLQAPSFFYVQEQLPEESPNPTPGINYSKNLEDFRAQLEETKILYERLLPLIENDAQLLEDSVQDGQLTNNEILPDLEVDVRLMQQMNEAFGQFMQSRDISYSKCLSQGICE